MRGAVGEHAAREPERVALRERPRLGVRFDPDDTRFANLWASELLVMCSV